MEEVVYTSKVLIILGDNRTMECGGLCWVTATDLVLIIIINNGYLLSLLLLLLYC